MRFCPQCGTPLMAGAKFCVECGRALSASASGAGDSGRASEAVRGIPVSTAFVFVFVAITVAGLAAAGWIMMKTPDVVRQQIASAPPISAPAISDMPSANPVAQNSTAAAPSAEASPAAGGQNAPDLPPGHPHIELPTEARTFIDKIDKDARSKPRDIAAWNKLGAVSMRAAMFDQSYYSKAEEAYAHSLKLDPDNPDALRGVGDIDYDKQHYDEAIAAYEHYLKKKPGDPQVRTDLGTMYLYTGNADQAIVQYQKAIAVKPDFFQAYYNMGIAYTQENKPADADSALKKALAIAPDDAARKQVNELVAKLSAQPAAASTQTAAAASSIQPSPGSSPAAQTSPAGKASPQAANSNALAGQPADGASPIAAGAKSPAASATPSPSGTSTAAASGGENDFHGAIEKMVRGLPIAGPKVGSVQWPDKLKAKIMMESFPMDQMPPFAKAKFLTDLKSGIDTAKKENKISSKVEVDIVDSASGSVMETVTQ